MLEGKYIIKNDSQYFKKGDIVEFVEGYYICGGYCAACENLKNIRTFKELQETFPDVNFEKFLDK